MGLLDLEDPLYAAFSRDDQYGVLGKKPQPLSEKIRLVVMAFTLVPLRLLGCLYFVLSFYLTCRQVRATSLLLTSQFAVYHFDVTSHPEAARAVTKANWLISTLDCLFTEHNALAGEESGSLFSQRGAT